MNPQALTRVWITPSKRVNAKPECSGVPRSSPAVQGEISLNPELFDKTHSLTSNGVDRPNRQLARRHLSFSH